jgi:hypothetical protein
MKIDPKLIGTIPEVECLRDELDIIVLRYETEVARRRSNIPFIEGSEIRPDIIADAIIIEMCATHFYGFVVEEFNTMTDLIAAMYNLET